MTNYEKISSSIEAAAEELCRVFEQLECENCPAEQFCFIGHNGMKDWLMQEGDKNDKDRKVGD